MLTTIIGRGHSGTRAMSHTLSASGVWMGEPLNGSGDLLPPQAMYEASRLIARHVRWLGGLEWDFSRLHTMPTPPEFESLIRSYLRSVLTTPAQHRGWIEVRFEDFVQRQDETLARLESYLGVKLARIPVNPEAVGRWKADTGANFYDFFAPAMERYGYEIPPKSAETRAES